MRETRNYCAYNFVPPHFFVIENDTKISYTHKYFPSRLVRVSAPSIIAFYFYLMLIFFLLIFAFCTIHSWLAAVAAPWRRRCIRRGVQDFRLHKLAYATLWRSQAEIGFFFRFQK